MCYVAAIKSLQRKLNVSQRDLHIDMEVKTQQNRQNWPWGPFFSLPPWEPDSTGLCWGLSPIASCTFTAFLAVIWAASYSPINPPRSLSRVISVVSPVMSVGTLEHAFSSFAFLGEAEALEDARMFWGVLVHLLLYVQEIDR